MSFARFAASRGRITRGRLAAFLTIGFGLGLALGFIFMGTMHAVSGLRKLLAPNSARVTAAASSAGPTAGRHIQLARLQGWHDAFSRPPSPQSLLLQFIEIGTAKHHGQEAVATNGAAADGAAAAGSEQEQQQEEAKEEEKPNWPTTGDTVHIAYTSNGSPYTNYQVGSSC